MNKKAFTMVELIAIITIIGVILLFALPNITATLERNKKDAMINDAKDFVEKAKNYINMNKTKRENPTGTYKLSDVDPRQEIKTSPFGNAYYRSTSKVDVYLDGNTYVYKVTLTDGKYKINTKTLKELNSDSKYTYVENY